MATPHVSGAMALLISQGHSPQEAVARILATADPRVACACAGILDVRKATAAPREADAGSRDPEAGAPD